MSFYDDASVYDILHAAGTAEAVDGLERIERLHSRARKGLAWLEPACGTARHLRIAAGRGRKVVGFDRLPSMIEYATSRMGPKLLRRADLFVADMSHFDRHLKRGSIGFAFNLINTIRHLHSDRAMLDHFAAIARVLAPGGVYAVGISLAAYGLEPPTEDTFAGRRGACEVRQFVQYEPAGGRSGALRMERVASHLTIVRGAGRGRTEEHRDSSYTLRSYDLAQWHKLVERSALRIEATVDEVGDAFAASEPGYAIFVLGARAIPRRTR